MTREEQEEDEMDRMGGKVENKDKNYKKKNKAGEGEERRSM